MTRTSLRGKLAQNWGQMWIQHAYKPIITTFCLTILMGVNSLSSSNFGFSSPTSRKKTASFPALSSSHNMPLLQRHFCHTAEKVHSPKDHHAGGVIVLPETSQIFDTVFRDDSDWQSFWFSRRPESALICSNKVSISAADHGRQIYELDDLLDKACILPPTHAF